MRQRGAARHLQAWIVITAPGTDAPYRPIWRGRCVAGCGLPALGDLKVTRPAQLAGATNAPAARLLSRGVTGGCRSRSEASGSGDGVRNAMRRRQAAGSVSVVSLRHGRWGRAIEVPGLVR